MQTKEILLKLRIQNGWSQEDLAERVYVTRQAVSRWENGETVPNTETLKFQSTLSWAHRTAWFASAAGCPWRIRS